MAGNLIFDEIPVDRLEPAILLEVKANYSQTGLLPFPVKNLIIGQKLESGTLKNGEVIEIVRPQDAIALFGAGSIGAAQVETFRKANRSQPLYVLGLADANDGVAAIGTIAFSGTLSSSVVLRFLIAGIEVRFNASAAASIDSFATNLANAINTNNNLPVTAVAMASNVKLTAKHKGEVGNDIDVRLYTKAQSLPVGLNVEITPMAGGSGNPDIEAALDQISSSWFTHITMPWADVSNIIKFADFLDQQYLATSKLDALGFCFKGGTYATLSEFGRLTNCKFLCCSGLNKSPTPPWVMAASAMGLASFHLTNDPARQLKSLVLPDVIAPDLQDQFIDEERDNLLRRGVSTLQYLDDGSVTFSRVITTHKKNNLGVETRAWLDIMTPATMTRIRYDWAAYVSLQYPRSKLARNDSPAASAIKVSNDNNLDSAIVTPRIMSAVWAGRCQLYADNGWIDDHQNTIKQSFFQIAPNDKNRLESRQIVDVMGNLMVMAGSLEFKANS